MDTRRSARSRRCPRIQGPARRTRARNFRVSLEALEIRSLLSDGLWLAQINGLPGDTRDVQIQAADDLLLANGLPPEAVQVVDHVGVDGLVVLQAHDG